MSSRRKILIIDDQNDVIMFTSAVLVRAGYKVLTSRTVTCLDLIFNEQPDLILLDVHMPGIGGEVAAGILTQERSAIRGKIVFHSARDPADLRRMAFLAGIDGFIQKASDYRVFLAEIGRFLGEPSPLLERVQGSTGEARPLAQSGALTATSPSRSGEARLPASVAPHPEARSRTPKALILDEDEALLCFLRMNLASLGIQVETSPGGVLDELLARVRPDLILVAERAAGIPLARLRAAAAEVPGHGSLRIFLFVEDGVLGIESRVREGGLDGFVRKSSNWAQVARAIRDVVGGTHTPERGHAVARQ